MLWKTDEKELLEKRGEDRGKLMLTGLSVMETSHGGREVSVRVDGHANPCQLELPVLPAVGTSLAVGS